MPVIIAESPFTFQVTPLKNQIYYNESAVYEITINNSQNVDRVFTLVVPIQAMWSFQTEPSYAISSFTVKKRSVDTFAFFITPTAAQSPSKYMIPLKIKSSLETAQVNLELYLKSITPGYSGYLPAIQVTIAIPKKVRPVEYNEIKIELNNRNVLTHEKVVVQVESPWYNTSVTTSLYSLEKKTLPVELRIPRGQPPEQGFIEIKVIAGDIPLSPIRKTMEIVSYGNIEEEITEQKEYLKTTTEIKYYNNGNIISEKELRYATTVFDRLFTSISADEKQLGITVDVENGKRYFIGALTLGSQETATVTIIRNYRLLFILFFAAMVVTCLYYLFRSPVTITKKAKRIKQDQHGSSTIKITLHVKNRTRSIVDAVTINDKLLVIMALQEQTTAGTMRPDKVTRQEKQGTILHWEVLHLEAFEERIITYMVKSKMHILGSVTMPPASVRYKNSRGRFTRVYSNHPRVGL